MDTLIAITPILVSVITGATPLILAASGELVTERSGVLNLGVEGMMLMGAIAAFATVLTTGNPALAILAGAAGGAGISLIFALLTQGLKANQVASGLALTIFGIGLTSMIGNNFVGEPYSGLPHLPLPVLKDIPVLGPMFFDHNALVYLGFVFPPLIAFVLYRTRAGLILRAVGENHDAAHAIGYNVIGIRVLAIMFGGALAGLGGAHISTALTPHWAEGMTAGKGWIALALVVFATWKPGRVMIGAYLFGGITIAQLHAQSLGIQIEAQFLNMLPYAMTILVLVIISSGVGSKSLSAPGSLGKNFHAS